MKTFQIIKRLINESSQSDQMNEKKDEREYDYEGDMAMSQLRSIIRNAQMMHDKLLEPTSNLPEWVQSKITLAQDYIETAANYLSTEMDESYIEEAADKGLAAKAKASGVSLSVLRKVYRRGVAAWNSGHRPGTNPQQWGMARVNSYITKGKGTYHGADKDLRGEDIDEACWDSHKQVGMKKKNGKMVPNCVPKEEVEEDYRLKNEPYHEGLSASTARARVKHWKEMDKKSDRDPSAYEPAPGDKTAKTKLSKHTLKYRKMYGEEITEEEKKNPKLGKVSRLPSGSAKKFQVFVRNAKGNIVSVKFGDPGLEIKRDDPGRRKNFRARHGCDTDAKAKDRTRPKYWSCRQWRAGAKVEA